MCCRRRSLFEKPSTDGTHKWLLGHGSAERHRSGVHPRQGPRHAVRVLAGRLRAELPVLLAPARRASTATCPPPRSSARSGWRRSHLGNVPHQQRKLTNVVMMGMGEPLLNFDNVVRAMSIMRDDLGFGLANKRVTLSTAGMVPMIDQLGEESDVSLAVSLHAPTDELRSELVPLNKKYPIAELMDACVRYALRKPRTSITFEYTHDEGRQRPARARARSWRRLMRKFDSAVQMKDAAKVNLIPFNPFPGTRFERSGRTTTSARSRRLLLDSGVLTHGAAHARRRHRRRLRPAQGPGHRPHPPPGRIPQDCRRRGLAMRLRDLVVLASWLRCGGAGCSRLTFVKPKFKRRLPPVGARLRRARRSRGCAADRRDRPGGACPASLRPAGWTRRPRTPSRAQGRSEVGRSRTRCWR